MPPRRHLGQIDPGMREISDAWTVGAAGPLHVMLVAADHELAVATFEPRPVEKQLAVLLVDFLEVGPEFVGCAGSEQRRAGKHNECSENRLHLSKLAPAASSLSILLSEVPEG